MNTAVKTDFYKTGHKPMYPNEMSKLYSNLTPRKSRMKGVNQVVVFGIQAFIIKFLIEDFNKNFFGARRTTEPRPGIKDPLLKEDIINQYKRQISVDTKHIEELWDLGYLPLHIKALPEGTICPIGVPCLTITNTHPNFGWLVNYLETPMSAELWGPITSATIAHEYKKLLTKYALETDPENIGFVQWQGHDFSMRGMYGIEAAILSGMGHLTSFTGTDTIPAIYALEQFYAAEGLIGGSVPATEHSVMCMGTKEAEIDTFRRLLKVVPTGILSVVSDTWDLWKVCTEYLPQLKEEILARDGKLVIRPDSGDPVDIICGLDLKHFDKVGRKAKFPGEKGVIELLWDIFGGTVNEQGYKVLDPHIGAIYGDSITLDRAEQICERLKAKGFASTNIVLGIGSFTYQYNTRDTFGFAVKATYGELEFNEYAEWQSPEALEPASWTERREIFKDPITDDGTKKSKKGLLRVDYNEEGQLVCYDQQTDEQEEQGLLQTVFLDGKLINPVTLEQVRERLKV